MPRSPTSASRSARRATADRASSRSFNEDHIAATTQAICEYRRQQGTDGPLFLGRDTHALSEPAWATALEVLAANDVTVLVDAADRYTPTPAVSHAILTAQPRTAERPRRRHRRHAVAQPAARRRLQVQPARRRPGRHRRHRLDRRTAPTSCSQAGSSGVRRVPLARCTRRRRVRTTTSATYVDDLPTVIDLDAIRDAGVHIGADPLGGASVDYWAAIAERHRLDLTVVNPARRPDVAVHDPRLGRQDPHGLLVAVRDGVADRHRRDEFQIATGNDADADRHGIVTPDGGLLNPNHFLAVAIDVPLRRTAPAGRAAAAVGKTLVSSSMIDRVADELGRKLLEVPVGFKWFVPGLLDGSVGFGGEESRRRVVPAPRRHRLDDRQGRDPARPARLRDPGGDRTVAVGALPRADRAVRRPGLRAHRRAGHARGEGGAGQAVARATSRPPSWPASRSSPR